MFSYDTLTANRKAFIDAAIEMFPELSSEITKKQIDAVWKASGASYPTWIVNPANRSGKAVYLFPNPNSSSSQKPQEPKVTETDEQISARIKDTYASMDELVRAVASNTVNSLVIAGGAGIGKSYTVNKTLSEHYNGEYGFVFHRGYLRASHLFRMLYENRQKGMTVVLDDCDIWHDETALNILKAALELKETRRIGWGSEKIFLDEDGEEIPRYFDFEGAVIFLTNLNVRDLISSGSKMAPHLAAIESRSLVLDMRIKSKREYLAVIALKLKEGLLSNKGVSEADQTEIMDFVSENLDRFSDISLRMIEKIAKLMQASPTGWRRLAASVCMK